MGTNTFLIVTFTKGDTMGTTGTMGTTDIMGTTGTVVIRAQMGAEQI